MSVVVTTDEEDNDLPEISMDELLDEFEEMNVNDNH